MPNEQTKRLTMGAMIIALFTILLAVSFYVPILNIVTSLFISLPIIWYSVKFDRKDAILVVIACLGISYFVGGLLATVLALLYVPIGYVIGDGIRNEKSKLYLLIASGMTFLFSSVIQYLIFVLIFNINPIQKFILLLRESADESLAIMKKVGELPEGTEERLYEMIFLIETVIPSFIIIIVFVSALIIIIVNLPVLRRLDVDVPKFPPFSEMRLPKAVLWYYLVVLIVSLFVELEKGTFAFMVFANATIVLRGLLFLQGISLIHFYIHEQKWPKWVIIVATILAFPLQSFVLLLGVIDLGFNIRSFMKDMNRK